jgi:hypothetical protein
MPKTIAMIISPGKTDVHQSPEKSTSKPFLIRSPSEGWVIGTPTPKKGQRRLDQDEGANLDGSNHDERRQDVGQHVLEDYLAVREPRNAP